jgi:hypothetical protein
MSQLRYALAAGVHACVADDQVVFLDLRQDRYMCLDRESSLSLLPIVTGLLAGDSAAEPTTHAQEDLLSGLASKNLVTSQLTNRRSSRVLLLPRAAEGLPMEVHERLRPGLRDVGNFYSATVRASLALRLLPIQSVVEKERRRSHALARIANPDSFEAARAAELMSIFRALHVFSSIRRQCLFHSLAIKLFLSQYAISPRWVFAVRMNPFGAHCWLQHERWVLNDDVEYISTFTPIMVV